MKRRRTQAERRAETRAAVLESACRLFGSKGYAETSLEEIAAEKGDLIAALSPDGVAVVPEADAFSDALAARAPGRVLRFGLAETADVRASDVAVSASGFRFTLSLPGGATAMPPGSP